MVVIRYATKKGVVVFRHIAKEEFVVSAGPMGENQHVYTTGVQRNKTIALGANSVFVQYMVEFQSVKKMVVKPLSPGEKAEFGIAAVDMAVFLFAQSQAVQLYSTMLPAVKSEFVLNTVDIHRVQRKAVKALVLETLFASSIIQITLHQSVDIQKNLVHA